MPGRRHYDFEAAVVQEVNDLHETGRPVVAAVTSSRCGP